MKKYVFVLFLALGIGLASLSDVFADATSEAILKLLIKKGVLTREEVDGLRAEVVKEQSSSSAPIEERVSKLEEDIKKTPKIANFLNGDMKIGGYIQTRYTTGPSKKVADTITINNAKIALSGRVNPEVAYKFEIGPHQTNGRILYDALVRAEYFPKAKITMGQFKVPFSEEYLTSSSDLKTADRAIFQGTISNEYSQGFMVEGDVLDNFYYAVAGVTGQDRTPAANDNEAKDVISRFVYTPFKKSNNKLLNGFQVGTAVEYGRQARSGNDEGGRLRNLGMLKYKYDRWYVLSEYVHQRQEQIPGIDVAGADGWYALFAYKFPLQVSKYKTELEPVFKVEQYDPSTGPRDGQDVYTLGLTWYPNKYFYIMANYQFREEQREDSNSRFILQSQVKF